LIGYLHIAAHHSLQNAVGKKQPCQQWLKQSFCKGVYSSASTPTPAATTRHTNNNAMYFFSIFFSFLFLCSSVVAFFFLLPCLSLPPVIVLYTSLTASFTTHNLTLSLLQFLILPANSPPPNQTNYNLTNYIYSYIYIKIYIGFAILSSFLIREYIRFFCHKCHTFLLSLYCLQVKGYFKPCTEERKLIYSNIWSAITKLLKSLTINSSSINLIEL